MKKKLVWAGIFSLSSLLLISSAYKGLHSSFCLFKTWRKKESHRSVDIEGIQEERDFLLIHQGGKIDDLVKWNLSTFHLRNTSWYLLFLALLTSVHEGRGNIVGQFMFLGQQHCKLILMPHMALQVLEGTC